MTQGDRRRSRSRRSAGTPNSADRRMIEGTVKEKGVERPNHHPGGSRGVPWSLVGLFSTKERFCPRFFRLSDGTELPLVACLLAGHMFAFQRQLKAVQVRCKTVRQVSRWATACWCEMGGSGARQVKAVASPTRNCRSLVEWGFGRFTHDYGVCCGCLCDRRNSLVSWNRFSGLLADVDAVVAVGGAVRPRAPCSLRCPEPVNGCGVTLDGIDIA